MSTLVGSISVGRAGTCRGSALSAQRCGYSSRNGANSLQAELGVSQLGPRDVKGLLLNSDGFLWAGRLVLLLRLLRFELRLRGLRRGTELRHRPTELALKLLHHIREDPSLGGFQLLPILFSKALTKVLLTGLEVPSRFITPMSLVSLSLLAALIPQPLHVRKAFFPEALKLARQ